MTGDIATATIEEGLDFACNLVQLTVAAYAKAHPEAAGSLLQTLCFYIEFRYEGELALAASSLARLAHASPVDGLNDADIPHADVRTRFWAQMRWVAGVLNLSAGEHAELRIPEDRPRVTFGNAD